jgi:hypothetical protein
VAYSPGFRFSCAIPGVESTPAISSKQAVPSINEIRISMIPPRLAISAAQPGQVRLRRAVRNDYPGQRKALSTPFFFAAQRVGPPLNGRLAPLTSF